MRTTKRKAVWLFDLDGTLLRTHGAGMRAMAEAFVDIWGWEDALAGVSPAGMTDPAIVRRACEQKGVVLTDEVRERFFQRYLDRLRGNLERETRFEVLPGIREFLLAWSGRRDVLIGLGTGNLEAGARLKLLRGGLEDFFGFGGFGSDAESRPELLRCGVRRAAALAGQEILAHDVVVIGDTPLDIAAARAIGARVLAVATGPFSAAALQSHAPDLIVESFNPSDKIEAFLLPDA